MFARTVDWIGRPDKLDGLIRYTHDSLVHLSQFDGFVGLSLIADRAANRCIATSAWQSEDAWKAAARDLMPIVATGVDMAGARIEDARQDDWDVALVHRDHQSTPGACSRVTWAQWAPADIDRIVAYVRDTIIPNVESDGFCSASLLVDRVSGRTCMTVNYDSVEAMIAARQTGTRLRATAASEFNGQVLEVGEFEVCIAHLRVPEFA